MVGSLSNPRTAGGARCWLIDSGNRIDADCETETLYLNGFPVPRERPAGATRAIWLVCQWYSELLVLLGPAPWDTDEFRELGRKSRELLKSPEDDGVSMCDTIEMEMESQKNA